MRPGWQAWPSLPWQLSPRRYATGDESVWVGHVPSVWCGAVSGLILVISAYFLFWHIPEAQA